MATETSPYLLEHAENPVDWYAWGPEALERARQEDKPILVSIGYSACHWCHVMARESFEDPDTAALMNRFFVCIKVDREERPDLDQVYMRAVQGMTGSGGWPMTVFLLPDGTPFYGGTYFPPSERFGMPSFRRVLTSVAEAYRLRKGEVLQTAAQVRDFLRQPTLQEAQVSVLTPELLDTAFQRLAASYDATDGGFGGAPKFPQPMLIDFLLRTAQRRRELGAQEMATHTLRAMAAGGMYDQLGGGFHRYSVDARWLVPHFEKMLYDNAQLARCYLEAWQLTAEPDFLRITEETLGFAAREMRAPEGGFFSALDADSEGEEGKFYVWTAAELTAVLGPEDAARLSEAFGATEHGNFEGRNILHAVHPNAPTVMAELRPRVQAVRDQRMRPHRDEKVIASWNGLMLRALAEAARVLGRTDLLELARANASFLLSHLRSGRRMLRSYKDGQARLLGYLEDQAAVADGLLTLYEASFERKWLEEAHALVEEMLAAFWDDASGMFFDTAQGHETLVVRPQDVTDNAVPSGTSLAVDVLLRAGSLFGREDWTRPAVRVLERLSSVAGRAPSGFGRLLAALDFSLSKPVELAFIGPDKSRDFMSLVDVVRPRYLPNRLLAHSETGENPLDLPLLRDRLARNGLATAYLCEGFVCQEPTTDPARLEEQLEHVAPRAPAMVMKPVT